nr:conotoxin precursor B1 [Conus judaeus]UMA83682.1 conotoxin precursor B1 [Conus judaeus]DAZ86381.1 TPA_inf: conotoxin precursor B1 [Conus judaeus]DAZ86656.1 TPA_inf: conotoxin precursor B1 [Conus judaeus]
MMQSSTCMCLLVPLLLFFHLTQRSDTADHGWAATDVRSADHSLKRFLHDFRRARKRRSDGRYARKQDLSVNLDSKILAEKHRLKQVEDSQEKLENAGR